jgi:type I restriction enzyme, R subunit
VLFRPVGSMVEFKQIIGRGTRLFPDQDKLSFQIIDYAGATLHFADPDFDGLPELVTEEEIDHQGEQVDEKLVASPAPVYETSTDKGTQPSADVTPEDLEAARARKYYVDDAQVFITAESVFVLDPSDDRLKVFAYEEFAADQVRRLYPHPDDLRARWRTADGRDEIIDELARRGVNFSELAQQSGLTDIDPFDLLVHIAWNSPLATRRDRVNRVKREQREFLQHFAPEARAVLDGLLEKYADHGIDQLDDLAVLEVPPLSSHGSPLEIAERFGGPEQLRRAVEHLGDLLYAA